MSSYQIMHRSEHESAAASQLGAFHPVVRRVLHNRDIVRPEQISHALAGLISPERLMGCDQATQRLSAALSQKEAIVIVGDYDVDGATATVLAIEALQQMGAHNVDFCVPNRFDYGYGLSLKLAQELIKKPVNLVITVDNGIASIAGVDFLKQHGIDVIVTDHHLPGKELPDAAAIVNPNQVGCEFPSKMLAGVGVIFYLMLALRSHLQAGGWFRDQGLPAPPLVDLLDLVALGTVADLVPLDENNRILVAQGVARMRSGHTRPGIKALMRVAQRDFASLVANDLGFILGPRLNAAGRLSDISTGICCLLAKSESEANRLADALNEINQQRKEIQSQMQTSADALVESLDLEHSGDDLYALALFDESWHEGVVGLVASRLKDKIGVPTAVFAPGDEGLIKGSCRSIKQVHIRDVLAHIDAQHPGLIVKYGGHAMAAGLSLAGADFSTFEQAFCAEVKRLTQDLPRGQQIWTDGHLQADEFNLELAQTLRAVVPWGQAFPSPTFDGKFKVLSARIVGQVHLKLCLQPIEPDQALASQSSIDAIAFHYLSDADKSIDLDVIDAVYTLDVNEFRGQKNLQLIIHHLEAA